LALFFALGLELLLLEGALLGAFLGRGPLLREAGKVTGDRVEGEEGDIGGVHDRGDPLSGPDQRL
jgi:hypothetical protein